MSDATATEQLLWEQHEADIEMIAHLKWELEETRLHLRAAGNVADMAKKEVEEYKEIIRDHKTTGSEITQPMTINQYLTECEARAEQCPWPEICCPAKGEQ